ncbi:hypothetical protein B484DRAFT_401483 [Ochromonadaceae sp. CCMP2298]|nr:hypothetical protein B484DRAFT_401483 [Ochromonadaceae sp. CCMP2298]
MRDLGIKPGAEVILHGNAIPMLESLHLQTQLMAHYRREKVVRSMVAVVAAQRRAAKERPDVLGGSFEDAPRRQDCVGDSSKDMDTVAGLLAHGRKRLTEDTGKYALF